MKKLIAVILFISFNATAQISDAEFCAALKKPRNAEVTILFQSTKNWKKIANYSSINTVVLGDLFLGLPDIDGDEESDQVDINGNGTPDENDYLTFGQKRMDFERAHADFMYMGSLIDTNKGETGFEYSVNSKYGKYVSKISTYNSKDQKYFSEDAPIRINDNGQTYTPYVAHSQGWDMYKYNGKDWVQTKGVDFEPIVSGDILFFNYADTIYFIDGDKYTLITAKNISEVVKANHLEEFQVKMAQGINRTAKLPVCKQ